MATVENDIANTILSIQARNLTWFDASLDNVSEHSATDALAATYHGIREMLKEMAAGSTISDTQLHTLAEELVTDLSAWDSAIGSATVFAVLAHCADSPQAPSLTPLSLVDLFVAATAIAAELLPTNPHTIVSILTSRHPRPQNSPHAQLT